MAEVQRAVLSPSLESRDKQVQALRGEPESSREAARKEGRMKIDIPFHGSRKDVLAKHYHVKPRPVPLTQGQNVAKQLIWFLCKVVIGTALLLAFIWGAFSL